MNTSRIRALALFLTAALFCISSLHAQTVKKPTYDELFTGGSSKKMIIASGVSSMSAEATEIVFLPDGGADVIFRGKIFDLRGKSQGKREVIWRYRDASRPLPIARGVKCDVRLGGKGEITCITYDVALLAVRTQKDGLLEFIATPETLPQHIKTRMHLRPHWVGVVTSAIPLSFVWSPTFGQMIGDFGEKGGGATEEDTLQKRPSPGIPVHNESGFTYRPGRDGWIPLSEEASGSDIRISKRQEIWS